LNGRLIRGRQAAFQVGVSEESVSRWRKDPDFLMELNARLKENQDAIQEKLRHLSTTALRVIEEIMIDPESAARDRLAASSKILDLVMRPQPPTDNGLLNQPVSIEIIRATRPDPNTC